MNIGSIFNILIEQPLINILVAIYQALITLHTPYALGFAIITMTAFIKIILYPFTASQMKMQKKMQVMAPHLAKIKETHKGDMKKQQEASSALYKEHGVNPLGCLPSLIQLPLLFGLYGVLRQIVQFKTAGEINKMLYLDALKLKTLWDTTFFGIPLGKTPADLLPKIGVGILLVVVITGLLQFIQSKMMAVPASEKPEVKKLPNGENKAPDFASTFQSQTLYLLPIMIGFFSFQFPIGLSLYWNTFSIFGIIQQYKIAGLGGLKDFIKPKE